MKYDRLQYALKPKSDKLRGNYTTQQRLKVNKLLERMNTALIAQHNFAETKPYKLKDIYRFVNNYAKENNLDFENALNQYYDKLKENKYLL